MTSNTPSKDGAGTSFDDRRDEALIRIFVGAGLKLNELAPRLFDSGAAQMWAGMHETVMLLTSKMELMQGHDEAAGSSVVVPTAGEMVESVVDAHFRAFSAIKRGLGSPQEGCRGHM